MNNQVDMLIKIERLRYKESKLNGQLIILKEKSYRKISTQTGYKFYYEDEDGNKVYYNEGKYVPRINDDELREK